MGHRTGSAGSAGLVADSRTVAGWTLVSRITGFGRVATMGAVLGPTYFGNLFQTSVLLPALIFALLGGSLVGAVLVPPLVRWVDGRDDRALRRLANGFFGIIVVVSAIIVVLGVLIAPLLLGLVTAAVDEPVIRQHQQQVGGWLLAMLLPQILFYGMAATGMAVQHAHGRFAIAAAAPVAENLGSIAVLGGSALVFGVGVDLDRITTAHLVLLGAGTTAAVAMHAAVQWWGAFRIGVCLVPWGGWRDPEVRRVTWAAFTSSGYTGLYNLVYFAILVVAGSIPGGVIAFQIGHSFAILPVALAAVPLAAAQLPRLSRRHHEENAPAFHATFRDSVGLTRFVALPAAFLLFVMSETLARAVAFGEMSAAAGIAMIAACIGSLGPGVIGEAMLTLSTSASYARRDGRAPFRAVALRAAIVLVGVVVAVSAMDGLAVLWTLGLTASAANVASAAYLYRSVTRALPPLPAPRRGWRVVAEVALSALAIAPGWVVALSLHDDAGSAYQKIGVAVVAMAVSGAAYLVMQWLRGSRDLAALSSEILGRRRHLRPDPVGRRGL